MTKRLTDVQRSMIEAATTIPYRSRGERRVLREILCRRCAAPMRLVEETGRWTHTDDGTDACVDPETMKPYNDNEESAR